MLTGAEVTIFPRPEEKNVLWLITSWADEPAYVAAQRFYRSCVKADYRIILKGHSRDEDEAVDLDEIEDQEKNQRESLSLAFFDYALNQDEPLRQNALYVADFVNEMVLPIRQATWIPRDQSVWLPNREIAQAWGEIDE